MTTDTTIIIPYIECVPKDQRSEWRRFAHEAWIALSAVDAKLLKQWGQDCLEIAVTSTLSRANALRGLLAAVVKGAWNEFKRFFIPAVPRSVVCVCQSSRVQSPDRWCGVIAAVISCPADVYNSRAGVRNPLIGGV
jgi:hypothetical protein